MRHYGNINLQQNELQNAVLPIDTYFPVNPKVGQLVFKDKGFGKEIHVGPFGRFRARSVARHPHQRLGRDHRLGGARLPIPVGLGG